MSSHAYRHLHKVQFYETDLMGIVHHSNYLRFFEEARVAWAHHHGMLDYQRPESASHFAVYETRVRHVRPAFFGNDLSTQVQVRVKGARIYFQYRMSFQDEVICLAETVHVSLNKELKLMRLPASFVEILEKEQWTETWL